MTSEEFQLKMGCIIKQGGMSWNPLQKAQPETIGMKRLPLTPHLSLLTSLPEATQFPIPAFSLHISFFSPLQISVSADSLAHLEKVPGLISIGPDLVT